MEYGEENGPNGENSKWVMRQTFSLEMISEEKKIIFISQFILHVSFFHLCILQLAVDKCIKWVPRVKWNTMRSVTKLLILISFLLLQYHRRRVMSALPILKIFRKNHAVSIKNLAAIIPLGSKRMTSPPTNKMLKVPVEDIARLWTMFSSRKINH